MVVSGREHIVAKVITSHQIDHLTSTYGGIQVLPRGLVPDLFPAWGSRAMERAIGRSISSTRGVTKVYAGWTGGKCKMGLQTFHLPRGVCTPYIQGYQEAASDATERIKATEAIY